MSFSEVTVDTFTPPAPLETAVLFLVFNRPDTTAQVFEAIRKARLPRLYVAADGPRPNRVREAEKIFGWGKLNGSSGSVVEAVSADTFFFCCIC